MQTYDLLFYIGICIMIFTAVAGITVLQILRIKSQKLNKELNDEYGE